MTRDVLLDARLGQAKETHRVEVRRIRIIEATSPIGQGCDRARIVNNVTN